VVLWRFITAKAL